MTGLVEGPRRYVCCECGRSIIQISGPLVVFCGSCLFQPGWFRHPKLRAAIAPTHDGRELVDRVMAGEALCLK